MTVKVCFSKFNSYSECFFIKFAEEVVYEKLTGNILIVYITTYVDVNRME